MPFVDFTTCKSTYSFIVQDLTICAGGVVGKGSCQGDSGGALFTTTNINNPVDAQIIGITSFVDAAGCANDNPGGYTDIPDFGKSWFEGEIAKNSLTATQGVTPTASGSKPAVATTQAAASSQGAATTQAAASSQGAATTQAAASSQGAATTQAAASSQVAAATTQAAASSQAAAATTQAAASSQAAAATTQAAASSQAAAATTQAAATSQVAGTTPSSTAGVSPSGSPSESLAASSGAVASETGTGSAGAVASSSGTRSKNSSVKTPTGLAAITCRQTCASSFRTCKFTVRRLRKCRRDKKDCVSKCGNVRPQGL
jgi:hypothetical protein